MYFNLNFSCFIFVHLISSAFSQIAVLGGGALEDNNTDVYGSFVNLSTPAGASPYIGIISAASDDSTGTGATLIQLFQQTYSVQNVEWLPINLTLKYEAENPAIALKVIKMTGIFFSGGDQERLDECLYTVGQDGLYHDTLVLGTIRQRYTSGNLVISGTSAGSDIQQGIPMITGGESWNGFVYGAFDHTDSEYPNDLSYDKNGGFRFFTFGLLDAHFGSMGRQGRTMKLLCDLIGSNGIGFGIDENTGIIVKKDEFIVTGQRGVYIIQEAGSGYRDGCFSNSSCTNFVVSYLTKDDQFNNSTRTITFAEWKKDFSSMAAQKEAMPSSGDIFSSPNNVDASGNRIGAYQFMIVAQDLFNSTLSNSTYGYTFETDPRLKVTFTKTTDSVAMYGELNNQTLLSFANLTVSVEEESLEERTEIIRSFYH